MADPGEEFTLSFPRRELIIPDGWVVMRGPLIGPQVFDLPGEEPGA